MELEEEFNIILERNIKQEIQEDLSKTSSLSSDINNFPESYSSFPLQNTSENVDVSSEKDAFIEDVENIKEEHEDESIEGQNLVENIERQKLVENIERLEKAILLIAQWTQFDLQILEKQGFQISQFEQSTFQSPSNLKASSRNACSATRTSRSHSQQKLPKSRINKLNRASKTRAKYKRSSSSFKSNKDGNQNQSDTDNKRITRRTSQISKHSIGLPPKDLWETGQLSPKKEILDPDDLMAINPNPPQSFMDCNDYMNAGSVEDDLKLDNGDGYDYGHNVNNSASPQEFDDDTNSSSVGSGDDLENDPDFVPSKYLNSFMFTSDDSNNLKNQTSTFPESGMGLKNYDDGICKIVGFQSTKEENDQPLPIPSVHLDIDGSSVKHRGPYTCPFCRKTTVSKQRHIEHLRVHTGEKPFRCNNCNYTGRSKQALTQHLKQHAEERSVRCEFCYEMFRSDNLKLHKKLVHGVGQTCPICGAIFSGRRTLRRHIKGIHENLRTVECPHCDQRFKRNEHLRRHLVQHSNLTNRFEGPDKAKPIKLPLSPESMEEDDEKQEVTEGAPK